MTLRTTPARWAVPAGTAAVVAAAVLVGQVPSAGADLALPERTAEELLTSLSTARVPGLSGTVETTSALGLPPLGALTGSHRRDGTGPLSLVSGSHVLRVWTAGPDRQRVTIHEPLVEYSVVRNGSTVSTYDSRKDVVTTRTLPAHERPDDGATGMLEATTPQEAARAALAAVGPTTDVAVDRTATVADRPTYTLVLTPRDERSLVGSVRLSVDGETSVPLQVQVLARGATTPVVEVGFTSVDFSVPADSVFATPEGTQTTPPGELEQPAEPEHRDGVAPVRPTDVRTTGSAWTTVVQAKGVTLPDAVAPLVASASEQVSVEGVPGRLLRTPLLSALLLDDGRAFAGAVTPETLVAAASE